MNTDTVKLAFKTHFKEASVIGSQSTFTINKLHIHHASKNFHV